MSTNAVTTNAPRYRSVSGLCRLLTFALSTLLLLGMDAPSGADGPKAAAAAGDGPPAAFTIIVLNDRRCAECQSTAEGIERILKGQFPSALFRQVDYSSDEGRRLYRSARVGLLPAFLLDPSARQSEGLQEINRWVADAGEYLILTLGGKYDPTREICDNGIDDNDDGVVDCSDQACKKEFSCRPEIPGRIDLFISAGADKSPGAVLGLKSLLASGCGTRLTVEVHYIMGEFDGDLISLFGPDDLEESLRQVCARDHYRDKDRYLEFLWCRAEDPLAPAWQTCARGAGLDPGVIGKCAEGPEGEKRLKSDAQLVRALDIFASPTWLLDNRLKLPGATPDEIRARLCGPDRAVKSPDAPPE